MLLVCKDTIQRSFFNAIHFFLHNICYWKCDWTMLIGGWRVIKLESFISRFEIWRSEFSKYVFVKCENNIINWCHLMGTAWYYKTMKWLWICMNRPVTTTHVSMPTHPCTALYMQNTNVHTSWRESAQWQYIPHINREYLQSILGAEKRYMWRDQAKWVEKYDFFVFCFFLWYFLSGYCLGFNLVKTPQRLGNWFQRYKQLKDWTNNTGSAELVIQRRLWYTSFDDQSIWIHIRVS